MPHETGAVLTAVKAEERVSISADHPEAPSLAIAIVAPGFPPR